MVNSISIQVSPDGGLFWFELDQIVGGEYDNNWIPTSYDISSYIGYNTTIRFIGGSNLEGFDLIKIDNVQIEFSGGQGQGGAISNDLLTVGDDFEIRSFNNNTGTANWIGDWIEIGEDNGANRGFVRIGKVPTTKNLGLGFLKENVGAQRMVDLSGAIYARLDLDYQVANLQSEKFIAVEISKDGGATWVELDRLKGSSTLLFSNQVSYNIANFISDQTIIRFVTSEDYSGGVVFINDIQIEYNDGTAPNNTYLDTLNVKPVWDMGFKGEGITVAVVDSGITNDQDFSTDPSLSTSSSRLIAQSNFNNDSSFLGDAYGHGTHVAGVIGGNGFMSNGVYQGIAPGVNLIGLKISDDQGMAYESDTVNALAWILEHKDEHNIRVVNLSINSTVEDSYHNSPLDAALEILWFNGIVVVASAGNQASDGEINIFNAAPANDPFIITVGASHENYTSDRADDSVAPFSAQGLTTDGYHKPDIVAPGKDIISVLANNSEWARNYPDRAVIGRQYFRISGTSVSASMVAGAAALILQAEPDLTPDQVKYRLINTGSTIGTDAEYPYMDIQFAVTTPTTEYANQGVIPHQLLAKMAMIAYWANQNGEDEIDWSSVNWSSVNWSSVNWSSVNWSSVNWSSVNWSSVNWSSVNWSSVNWSSVNWSSVNWSSVNWSSVNWSSVNWSSVNWGSVDWDN